MTTPKSCERCGQAVKTKGNRFCKDCAKQIRTEMQDAGYLQAKPSGGRYRGADAREATWETQNE